jgi:hypothetical protein
LDFAFAWQASTHRSMQRATAAPVPLLFGNSPRTRRRGLCTYFEVEDDDEPVWSKELEHDRVTRLDRDRAASTNHAWNSRHRCRAERAAVPMAYA